MRRWKKGFGSVALVLALAGFAATPSRAAPPAAVAVPARVGSMAAAVKVGAALFARETFGGERSCQSCHANGGRGPDLAGAAAAFPRFVARSGRVQTLEEQVVHCIQAGNRGKPPALGSVALDDLVAYVTSLSKGSPIGAQFGGK